MKINRKQLNYIFLPILMMILSQYNAFAQEVDSTRIIRPGLFTGLSFGPSQTNIYNEGVLSVSNLVANKKISFGGLVEVGYFFSPYFGLSSGIGYASYNTQLTLTDYQNKFNTTDTENEAYERRVTAVDIKEVQKIGLLTIPLCLNFRVPLNKSIGLHLQTGINMIVPLSKKYSSNGTFTFKGYYPSYNVLLENLPAYGFPSNFNSISGGNLKLNPIGFSAIVSLGMDFMVQKNIQAGFSFTYQRSLSNISAYTSPENFQLSSDINQINSLMGGSTKATDEALGLNIMVRYFIKRGD
jgi:hypothetical protein